MTMFDAIQEQTVFEAALAYREAGCSVIPVKGKIAGVSWVKYQATKTPYSHIHLWNQRNILDGVAIICGQVSDNLVVVDLDGQVPVQTFHKTFPELCNTLTIKTGSGKGEHLYYRTTQPTVTTRTKGYELRSDGCYVVAPPSVHPSGYPYEVWYHTDVMRVNNLDNVREWIMGMIRAANKSTTRIEPRPVVSSGHNPRWVQVAINRQLSQLASASAGDANNILNIVSYSLARIVANPNSGLVESNIKADIIEAAQHLTNRDGLRATLATIESGWNAGIQKPAHIPEPRVNNGNRK